jgi:hypothetical protein
MKFFLMLLLLSSLALAQSAPKWRWLEYTKDMNLEYSYVQNWSYSDSRRITFLADVVVRKSERKTSYNSPMLSLTPSLRDAATQKPEVAGSFNTILFRGFLSNDFIFGFFNGLEFQVGESKMPQEAFRLSVKANSSVAGIKGYVVEVFAPNRDGLLVLTSEFTIAPEFPVPLKIRTFSGGRLENVIELKRVKP